MTYAAYETSAHNASPVELYTFSGSYDVWHVTSCARDKTHPSTGILHTALVGLTRGEIILTTSGRKKDMSIEVPLSHPIAQFFFYGLPTSEMRVKIERYHLTDPDLEVLTKWEGYLYQPDFDIQNQVCKFIGRSDPRQSESVLSKCFAPQCQHNIYDANCGLHQEDWVVTGSVTSVSDDRLSILVPAAIGLSDDYFRAGYVQHIDAGITRSVMVRGSVSATGILSLYEPIYQLVAGNNILLLPGCMSDPVICDSVFDNKNQALWFQMPTKNPYTTNQGIKGV